MNLSQPGIVPGLELDKSMITHGLSDHPVYKLWGYIKKRCENPADISYKWYGGKGIKMCLEWQNDFMSFYNWCLENGWQKGLSIDRKDDSSNYSPSNCNFISRSLNSKKRHFTAPVDHKGEKNPSAKLTIEEIKNLKEDLIKGFNIQDLSHKYKISTVHINRIKNGKRWKHVSITT
jgi:hypothetical protein